MRSSLTPQGDPGSCIPSIKAIFALPCYPSITHGTLTASSWICKNSKDPVQVQVTLRGILFSFQKRFSLSQCPSSLSPPQKTMPALESQIRDTLHKTLADLQRYNRGTPQTESEKLVFLTDVSISVGHRAEQGGDCGRKRNCLKLSKHQHGSPWEVRGIHHFCEGHTDKPHLQK